MIKVSGNRMPYCIPEQGGIGPWQELYLGFVANVSDHRRNLVAFQVLQEIPVDANSIFEKHIIQSQTQIKRNKGSTASLETIHIGKQVVHRPNQLPSVHDILVDLDFLQVGESSHRLNDHESIKICRNGFDRVDRND